MITQDIQRPPAAEYANILCDVAFYMHNRCVMDSQSFSLQAFCSHTTAISPNASTMLLLCRLPHTWKFKFGIQFCGLLPVSYAP